MAKACGGGVAIMRSCYDCKSAMVAKRQNYPYTEAGLRSVVLMNICVYHCPKCGAIVPEIPDVGVLHRRIAMDLLHKDTLLSGEEVRFLRKVAGLSATELGRVMGVTNVAVSRWETNAKEIGVPSDRILRLVCFARIVERLAGESGLTENIAQMARLVTSLNLTSLLKQIQDRAEGSMPIRIDPNKLSEFAGRELVEAVQ